jgi:archaellum component FlaG (FlaF/FlaG flagellin family)
MEGNPFRRVLTSKAILFAGLAMLVAAAGLVIASMTVDQAGAAQQKAKPRATVSFGAKEVINTTGDKALTGTYQKRKGGTLLISAAGSGWSKTKDQKIGMNVLVNGNQVGTAQVWTNEAESHKAFVPAFEVVNNVSKGQVNIKLEPLSGTEIDQNDYFRVTVEEQPRG